jgi:hypothetical protein
VFDTLLFFGALAESTHAPSMRAESAHIEKSTGKVVSTSPVERVHHVVDSRHVHAQSARVAPNCPKFFNKKQAKK